MPKRLHTIVEEWASELEDDLPRFAKFSWEFEENHNHPFNEQTVSVTKAVAYIADALYPGEQPKPARDRVRKAISYHHKIGRLNGKYTLDTARFLQWAREQWNELPTVAPELPFCPFHIPGFRVYPAIEMGGVRLVEVPDLPNDLSDIKLAWVALHCELDFAKREIERLRSALDAELTTAGAREISTLTRKKLSKAGHRGGRGRGEEGEKTE